MSRAEKTRDYTETAPWLPPAPRRTSVRSWHPLFLPALLKVSNSIAPEVACHNSADALFSFNKDTKLTLVEYSRAAGKGAFSETELPRQGLSRNFCSLCPLANRESPNDLIGR